MAESAVFRRSPAHPGQDVAGPDRPPRGPGAPAGTLASAAARGVPRAPRDRSSAPAAPVSTPYGLRPPRQRDAPSSPHRTVDVSTSQPIRSTVSPPPVRIRSRRRRAHRGWPRRECAPERIPARRSRAGARRQSRLRAGAAARPADRDHGCAAGQVSWGSKEISKLLAGVFRRPAVFAARAEKLVAAAVPPDDAVRPDYYRPLTRYVRNRARLSQ